MSPIRKGALVWVLVVTAVAVATLAGSFIYLREHHLTDQALIEVRLEALAAERGYRLEEARKAGASNSAIAAHFAKQNRAEFDHLWWQIVVTVASVYVVIVLSIFAFSLIRESRVGPPAS